MTVIGQRTKGIEEIEKYNQKTLELCTTLYVCVYVGYILALLCVDVKVIFCVYVYEDTCAVRQIWEYLLDIWGAMCSQISTNRRSKKKMFVFVFFLFLYIRVCVCVCVCGDDFN